MAEQFDLVTWMKDFEQVNGRPPTSQEAEKARALLERYTMADSVEDVSSNQTAYWDEKESAGTVTAYKPKAADRWKAIGSKGLSWFGKALLGILLTPVYLTMFVVNLFKSFLAVCVMWFVTKIAAIIFFGFLAELTGNGDHPENSPFFKWVFTQIMGPRFFTDNGGTPLPNPVFTGWLIGIITVVLALFMTFSHYDDY